MSLLSLAEALPIYSAETPFQAHVLVNRILTGPGSSAEKRHVEIGLRGVPYAPGDALGVVPRNDPRLVEAVLASLRLDGGARVQIGGRDMPLALALASKFEIAVATPRFLHRWAMLSGSAELRALAAPAATEARRRYLRDHHVQDIARDFPVPGLDPEAVIPGLRPLQPRLYSIASSPAVDPDRAAITTATLAYQLHGETRLGAVTGYEIPHAEPGSSLSVFVQPDQHFHQPHGDRGLVMIGAGTGVAPFRAFLADRRARGQKSKAWLVFGTRTRRHDLLYAEDWQQALDDGTLTRLDLAFSRDLARKVYVQHVLLAQADRLYGWLQEGAAIYVCGDAAAMAPAVHAALLDIIETRGHTSPEAAAAYLRRLAREGRYCRSIY